MLACDETEKSSELVGLPPTWTKRQRNERSERRANWTKFAQFTWAKQSIATQQQRRWQPVVLFRPPDSRPLQLDQPTSLAAAINMTSVAPSLLDFVSYHLLSRASRLWLDSNRRARGSSSSNLSLSSQSKQIAA